MFPTCIGFTQYTFVGKNSCDQESLHVLTDRCDLVVTIHYFPFAIVSLSCYIVKFFVCWQEDLLDRLLIHSKCTGFIGSNKGTTAKPFYCRQLTNDHISFG